MMLVVNVRQHSVQVFDKTGRHIEHRAHDAPQYGTSLSIETPELDECLNKYPCELETIVYVRPIKRDQKRDDEAATEDDTG